MWLEFAGALYYLGKACTFYKDNKEFVEVAKDGYETLKGAKEFFEIKEGDLKAVDTEWLEKSGFQDRMKELGYALRWTKPERIALRELDGYEVMYEIDKDKKVKRKLVLRDGLTLLGKKA